MTSFENHPDLEEEIEKDEYFYTLKKRIYQSAKEGFSLNLVLFLNKIESLEVRNIIVNQVSVCWGLILSTSSENKNFPLMFTFEFKPY